VKRALRSLLSSRASIATGVDDTGCVPAAAALAERLLAPFWADTLSAASPGTSARHAATTRNDREADAAARRGSPVCPQRALPAKTLFCRFRSKSLPMTMDCLYWILGRSAASFESLALMLI
jgi:hypothetical protein